MRKRQLVGLGLLGLFGGIVSLAVYAAMFAGGVWFVLWALQQFGVI